VTIDEHLRSQIRRLYYADHYKVYAICQVLGVHHDTVKRAINFAHFRAARQAAKSKLEPFHALIVEHLETYRRLTGTRLMQILVDRGYTGSISLLRLHLRRVRPRANKPYMRMTVHAGEQGQVDWAHCGEITIGRAKRKLYLFVMVLSYSRAIYARFCVNQNTSTFLLCHELAFEYFAGIPRTILYDNLKSVVIARRGDQVRFNDEILGFSGFYCFEPRPCHPYRGNEKGRVERTIRYLRDNYLAAREMTNMATMNECILQWCDRIGNRRPWPDDRRLRVDQKWSEEKPRLIRLTDRRMNPKDQHPCRSGKTPWIIFDLNSYSIPPDYLGRPLLLQADFTTIEILCDGRVVARHVRSYDRGRFVEDPLHKDQLIEHKHFGRGNLFRESIVRDFPAADKILTTLFERGHDMNSLVRQLYRLRHDFGAEIFESSLAQLVGSKHISLEALRVIMQHKQRQSKLPPPIAVELPDDPKIRNLEVTSHPLSNYDKL
jgi:transposase